MNSRIHTPFYIFFLNPDYVAACSLRSLHSNYTLFQNGWFILGMLIGLASIQFQHYIMLDNGQKRRFGIDWRWDNKTVGKFNVLCLLSAKLYPSCYASLDIPMYHFISRVRPCNDQVFFLNLIQTRFLWYSAHFNFQEIRAMTMELRRFIAGPTWFCHKIMLQNSRNGLNKNW